MVTCHKHATETVTGGHSPSIWAPVVRHLVTPHTWHWCATVRLLSPPYPRRTKSSTSQRPDPRRSPVTGHGIALAFLRRGRELCIRSTGQECHVPCARRRHPSGSRPPRATVHPQGGRRGQSDPQRHHRAVQERRADCDPRAFRERQDLAARCCCTAHQP